MLKVADTPLLEDAVRTFVPLSPPFSYLFIYLSFSQFGGSTIGPPPQDASRVGRVCQYARAWSGPLGPARGFDHARVWGINIDIDRCRPTCEWWGAHQRGLGRRSTAFPLLAWANTTPALGRGHTWGPLGPARGFDRARVLGFDIDRPTLGHYLGGISYPQYPRVPLTPTRQNPLPFVGVRV
jgi:hypothetical protein